MEIANEDLDLTFMVGDEGLDVLSVKEFCTLSLRKHKIGEEEEADPAVKGEPAEDEDSPGFGEEDE